MNSVKHSSSVGGSATSDHTDLAGALHEVSNALTAVMGWLQRARGSLQPGTEERESADIAYSHARLAYAVARRAIGAPVADQSEVRSAVALAHESLRGVEQAAARKGVTLKLGGEDQDSLLRDATNVHQILLNLLLNAIAFSPDNGEVKLSVRNLGQQMRFTVSDQGPGVPADRVETLFTARHSTRPGGAGLGLRYSKNLAEDKGGDLRLLDHEGIGAKFELRWPIGDTPSTTLQKAAGTPQLRGLKVLVLEDDEALVSLLELGMASSGVELICLKSLAELKQFFAEGKTADLALVDLSPVSARPSEALMIIHSHVDPTPLVVMSGHTVDSIPGVHVAGWVRKPFDVSEVMDIVARVSHRA